MKKIFAKELAALAVLALAFTGCNTAFEGTNANFAEKEAQYTDRSGATQTTNDTGDVTVTGELNVTNKKNVMTVTVYSFSKINLASADSAIKFQRLTKNAANDAYYPTRGAELPKTRVKAVENTGTTTITYEVDATGITEDRVAFFVDATKLKTKGGTPVLALDNNTKRGEESDSMVKYSGVTYDSTSYTSTYSSYTGSTTFTISGMTTTPVSTGTGSENFRPTYAPTAGVTYSPLSDASGKATGVYRFRISATNKNAAHPTLTTEDYESGLAAKLNDAVVIQYRKPGSKTYAEKKLSWTWHETAQTTAGDDWTAHSYTADTTFDEIGTEWRAYITNVDGFVAPAWYKDVYNHPAIVYSAGHGAGSKTLFENGTAYTLHKTIPSYIVVAPSAAAAGTDATSTFSPDYTTTAYTKAAIRTTQKDYFTVTTNDNWFQVSPSTPSVRDLLDPATTKDFIVVDKNNKKIAADVEVITYSYNDSTTLSGKVNYVKVTVKDARYRNSLIDVPADTTNGTPAVYLKVCVGEGVKIKENKTYPNQKSFGLWKDVTDDDYAGYVALN